jgi:hypothetical protein
MTVLPRPRNRRRQPALRWREAAGWRDPFMLHEKVRGAGAARLDTLGQTAGVRRLPGLRPAAALWAKRAMTCLAHFIRDSKYVIGRRYRHRARLACASPSKMTASSRAVTSSRRRQLARYLNRNLKRVKPVRRPQTPARPAQSANWAPEMGACYCKRGRRGISLWDRDGETCLINVSVAIRS